MANRSWFDSFDMNQMQGQGMWQGQGQAQNQGQGLWQGLWQGGQQYPSNATQLPTQTAPTQFGQPQVSPTRQYVQRNVTNTVVPHYHPSHLTTVNQNFVNNQHYFPHTESVVNEFFETDTMCGTPFNPRGHARGCGCSKQRRGR
jgi:spore coat protein D